MARAELGDARPSQATVNLDSLEESLAAFERGSISAPSNVVDTADGYSLGWRRESSSSTTPGLTAASSIRRHSRTLA